MREERKCSTEEMGESYYNSSSKEVMAVHAAERNRSKERRAGKAPGAGRRW